MKKYHAPLLFLAFTVFWTITEETALRVNVSAIQVVWTRYAIHVAAMILLFAPKHGMTLVRTPNLPRQVGRSLLMLAMPLCFIVAFSRMPLHNAMASLWFIPMLILIVDRLVIGERRGWKLPVTTLVGFVGTMIIIQPSPPFGWNSLIGIAGALCFAVYAIVTREMQEEPILPKLFHTAFWVVLALTPFVPFFWQPPSRKAMIAMSLVAIFGWITLFFLDRAVDAAPPAILAPLFYCILLWTEFSHWIIQRSPPSHGDLAGSLLILGAVGATILPFVVRRLQPQQQRQAQPQEQLTET